MENFVYNLGGETAKLMNSLYSINKTYESMTALLTGNSLVLESKAISPFKSALPRQLSGITGSLFLQGNIAKSFGSNTYIGVTGSPPSIGLLANNDMRYTKMSQSLSGSTLVLNSSYSYEIFANMKEMDFEPSFYLNTSNYNDGSNFVYISNKDKGVYINNLLGFTADSYNVHFGQTTFAKLLENYGKQVTGFFESQKADLQSSFEELVLNFAEYAATSYSNSDCKDNFFDLSNNVIDAFEEFASINLNV